MTHRLMRKVMLTQAQADALRHLTLHSKMNDADQAAVENALYHITETPRTEWLFVKISQEQWLGIMQDIKKRSKYPYLMLQVLTMAAVRMRQDTGEVMATRGELAEDIGTTPSHISRAMSELIDMGVVSSIRRGTRVVYFVSPHVSWNGSEHSRQSAATSAPALRLVSDNTQ